MHQSLPKYLKGVGDYIYIYTYIQFILKVDRGQINLVFGDERKQWDQWITSGSWCQDLARKFKKYGDIVDVWVSRQPPGAAEWCIAQL